MEGGRKWCGGKGKKGGYSGPNIWERDGEEGGGEEGGGKEGGRSW